MKNLWTSWLEIYKVENISRNLTKNAERIINGIRKISYMPRSVYN